MTHELPLVIHYEAAELQGRWGVLRRIIRRGDTSSQYIAHFKGTQEEAIERAGAMQYANDTADEEWKKAIAYMDAARSKK